MTEELKQKLIEFENEITNEETKISYNRLLNEVFVSNCLDLRDEEDGWSLLHYAINFKNTEVIKLLLKYGINVNLQDEFEETAIFHAIYYSNIEIIKLLIEYGTNLNIKSYNDFTPLDYAIECENTEIIKMIKNAEQIRQDFLKRAKEKTLEEKIEEDKDKTMEEIAEELREEVRRVLMK